MKFVKVANVSTQSAMMKDCKYLYGVGYLQGDQIVGYSEEIDRDEDRIYFDYFVREDFVK